MPLRATLDRFAKSLIGADRYNRLRGRSRPTRTESLGDLADPTEVYDPYAAGEALPDGYEQKRPRDAFLPIYDPRFVPAGRVRWGPTDLVIGVAGRDEAKAYPVWPLNLREMVIDYIDATPIIVTWCPKCASAMVFRREIDGKEVVFGHQGGIYLNAMTWWDHDTGSIWSQPLGEAVAGPRKGATVDLVPSTLTTWASWRAMHPDTRALKARSEAHRYQLSDLNVVVAIRGKVAAYPHRVLSSGEVINDRVGGTALAVFADPTDTNRWNVLERTCNGAVLTLTRGGEDLVDEDGSIWDPTTGVSLAGPRSGQVLSQVPAFTMHPDDFTSFWPDGRTAH